MNATKKEELAIVERGEFEYNYIDTNGKLLSHGENTPKQIGCSTITLKEQEMTQKDIIKGAKQNLQEVQKLKEKTDQAKQIQECGN